MLHLFPLRLTLTVFALIALTSYAVSAKYGIVSSGTWLELGLGITKIATPSAVLSILIALMLWRWGPKFVQDSVFPYLGGTWTGEIEFAGRSGLEKREVTLRVEHNLGSIRMALVTTESTSQTLVVHARRAPLQNDVVKLIYIYEVERREGFIGAGDRYRGCAFIDVHIDAQKSMIGSYQASPNRAGSIRTMLYQPTPWWKLWC
jgi:hypothetical protein